MAKSRKKGKRYNKIMKIEEKIKRLNIENNRIKKLDEAEIVAKAEFYGLKVRMYINGDIEVSSAFDKWLVVCAPSHYKLYHMGVESIGGKNKDHYHLQDAFADIDFMFASIYSHDDYKIGIKKRRCTDLLAMI